MALASKQGEFKSPLYQMTQTTPTCLWNDSASEAELTYAIDNGAVGATCNPVIALTVVRQEIRAGNPGWQSSSTRTPSPPPKTRWGGC